MTEAQGESAERIKQHFAVRVINEARIILEVWQRVQTLEWNKQEAKIMQMASERLLRYAERFGQNAHVGIAEHLLEGLAQVEENNGRLRTADIEKFTELMQQLSQTGLRQNDRDASGFVVPMLRRPLYIAMEDFSQAESLAFQLAFFGVQAETFAHDGGFEQSIIARRPPAIILDVDFGGKGKGLELAAKLQQTQETPIPILFYSEQEADAIERLAAVRAGGEGFFVGDIETSSLLELIENFSRSSFFEPYRVLVVDDSRAQSVFTERTLNSAGVITAAVNDPTLALDKMLEFAPDLVILDMYMPQCSGPELAKVIRQSERFVGVPIIYLSGEEDLAKQLNAMSQGADDFLTKPVMPHHLIATVRNRAVRARNLKARIVRDSLTGLYSHTHILQLLEDSCVKANKTGQPLSFVMLDIDHFKKVNDTYGHPVGDKVIKSLALYLKQRLRKTDHIGRYGGEEFALVLPNTSAENAVKVVEQIRQRFSEISHGSKSGELTCTFSAGVASYDGQMDVLEFSGKADEALYAAKDAGRNRVALYGADSE